MRTKLVGDLAKMSELPWVVGVTYGPCDGITDPGKEGDLEVETIEVDLYAGGVQKRSISMMLSMAPPESYSRKWLALW